MDGHPAPRRRPYRAGAQRWLTVLSLMCAALLSTVTGHAATTHFWLLQSPKLIGSAWVTQSGQGVAVALASDGNTAIVGGSADNGSVGAAWVWTQDAGGWKQQGPKLVGADAVGTSRQGAAVAVSPTATQ